MVACGSQDTPSPYLLSSRTPHVPPHSRHRSTLVRRRDRVDLHRRGHDLHPLQGRGDRGGHQGRRRHDRRRRPRDEARAGPRRRHGTRRHRQGDRRRRLRRGGGMSASVKHFIRHYLEMVVAMFLGMAVLGVPAGWALGAFGVDWNALTDRAPALMFLGMATTMTVPMVGWMMYRGHGRHANAEMSASMFL